MAAKPVAVSTLALVLTAWGVAQKGGVTPSAPSNPNAEQTSGVGKFANWDQMLAHQHGSLYFMGKVQVQGGVLPWDPIPVIVTCNGKTSFNTQTDPKGSFKIQAAVKSSEVAAQAPGDDKKPTPSQLIGCEVHAVLEGFTSTPLTIGNGSIMDNPDLGTINMRIDERATGSAISATTSSAPKDALKNFDKAKSEAIENHPDSAQHDLEKAVKVDPQFAEAWYQLGKIEEPTKPDDALAAYAKATTADPDFAPPYQHIAAIAATEKKWQTVVDATEHALKLNPAGTAQLWYFNAVGNYNLGHAEVAETSAKTSLAMDPSHVAPNTEQLLAVMLAARGDYPGALDHLRNCLTYTPPGPSADLMKQQVAQLEKIVTRAAK
jgi:tetratricopeptide (TPR) repeat protein